MKLYYVTKRTFKPSPGNVMDEPSMTIQDEVLPLAIIIQRAMQGFPIAQKPVFYFDTEDIDAINRYHAPHSLDMTDLDALQNHITQLQMKVEEALKLRNESEPEPVIEPKTEE